MGTADKNGGSWRAKADARPCTLMSGKGTAKGTGKASSLRRERWAGEKTVQVGFGVLGVLFVFSFYNSVLNIIYAYIVYYIIYYTQHPQPPPETISLTNSLCVLPVFHANRSQDIEIFYPTLTFTQTAAQQTHQTNPVPHGASSVGFYSCVGRSHHNVVNQCSFAGFLRGFPSFAVASHTAMTHLLPRPRATHANIRSPEVLEQIAESRG